MIMQPDSNAASVDTVVTPSAMELTLQVRDPELCDDLQTHSEGRERHDFAIDAMRIGALAMRRAQGQFDADRVRSEGARIVEKLSDVLGHHQEVFGTQLTSTLKEYFDPSDGRFNERVERLLIRDGELDEVLRRAVGSEGSELSATLAAHVGEGSPLLRLLDPEGSEGIAARLGSSMEDALTNQREHILREFSLDNPKGALGRLVGELKESNGRIVDEFSLDDDNSALSRLVRRTQAQHREITSELSLDHENSALARIRRELLDVLKAQQKDNTQFQQELGKAVAALVARREESKRSTRHGDDFEATVVEFIQNRSQRRGDVATATGNTTGKIRNCKKGDAVVELGPEHVAAGGRLVAEAKENVSYTLQTALAEIEMARKNRNASAGLFVFSTSSAPSGLEPFSRYGNDVVVVWDAEDPATDVRLEAGLELARALVSRQALEHDAQEADLQALDRSIREIEKQLKSLDEINTWAGTIKSNGEKIVKRVDLTRKALVTQIEQLDVGLADLRSVVERS